MHFLKLAQVICLMIINYWAVFEFQPTLPAVENFCSWHSICAIDLITGWLCIARKQLIHSCSTKTSRTIFVTAFRIHSLKCLLRDLHSTSEKTNKFLFLTAITV